MSRPSRLLTTAAAVGALCAVPVLAGCTDNAPRGGAAPTSDPRTLTVQASDTACAVSAGTAPSGKITFKVTNAGAQVNEFYLLGADGLRILGEIENIGPGISRDLVLSAPPGSYFTACKPGMIGDGIRAPFGVSDSGDDSAASGEDGELLAQANANYGAYIRDQTEQLLDKTQAFVTAYTAGQDDQARKIYPQARVHWERIETVAESFGDLDPKMDAREADLEPGQKWDRLAPDGEGPLAGPGEGLPAAQPGRPGVLRS